MTQIFTVDQLCISPFNVRLHAQDAEQTKALQASIATHGLMYPLFVHDMTPFRDLALPGEPVAAWGVLAGGRRLRAIRSIIADGKMPADFEIEGIVRNLPPTSITQLSLSENLLRRNLHPYEIQAAIARAADQGADVNEIAEHIGQEPSWVRRQFRLGRLMAEIFDAYAGGRLSEEQAQAFAATEDEQLQRAAWTHFTALHHTEWTPVKIRAWYKIGDPTLDRLLRFVGADAYRADGGRYELDLFADGPERGRVVDDSKLRDLAENKLGALRTDLRRRTGRPALRFASEPPQHNGQCDYTLEFFAGRKGNTIILPGEQVVVTIDVTASGDAQTRYWWASRKAQRDASRGISRREADPAAPSDGTVQTAGFEKHSDTSRAARAAVKDEHGLTADGLQVLRSARREVLRALLVADALNDGELGRDYAVWSQLRQELRKLPRAEIGARILETVFQSAEDPEPADVTRPHLEEMKAHGLWTGTLAEMQLEPFITIDDPADAFAAFHFASDRMKKAAGAVLAGLALYRSCNAPGWRISVHNRIADILGTEDPVIRELWHPTARFMSLLPKMKRLELAQPHVDPAAFRDWHTLPDSTLTGAVAGAVEQVPGWVHPLLSFGVASERSTDQREAAE